MLCEHKLAVLRSSLLLGSAAFPTMPATLTDGLDDLNAWNITEELGTCQSFRSSSFPHEADVDMLTIHVLRRHAESFSETANNKGDARLMHLAFQDLASTYDYLSDGIKNYLYRDVLWRALGENLKTFEDLRSFWKSRYTEIVKLAVSFCIRASPGDCDLLEPKERAWTGAHYHASKLLDALLCMIKADDDSTLR